MTKSEYLANSAKLLFICSLTLLVANCLSVFAVDGSQAADIASKMSNISFYVVFFLSFIAFNGEGISHKRNRNAKRRRITVFMKVALLFAFLYRYIKVYVIRLVRIALLMNGDERIGDIANLLLAMVNTVASYGFVLLLVSLWYLYRDSCEKKLFSAETASFIVALCYNLYKVFYYAVNNYGIKSFSKEFTDFFANEGIFYGLCIAQYTLNTVMFLAVSICYLRKASDERDAYNRAQKRMVPARSIYNTDCIGIDSLDDDFA